MTPTPTPVITLATTELLPPHWLHGAWGDDIAVYNPAIVRDRERLLLAYRVDLGRGPTMQRKIGLCELNPALQIIPGSVRALSDTIQGGHPQHYDPRFLIYQDRLFVHYNNNFQTRPNQLFMVELDPDTLAARSPARPLHLAGPRRLIEKNWMFFAHDHELFAVYQIAPQIILKVNLAGQGAIECRPVHTTRWDVSTYAQCYGAPLGGTPPVRHGDGYLSFFHSKRPLSRLQWVMRYWPVAVGTPLPRYLAALERRLRQPFAQVRYYAGAYSFEAVPPFRPRWITKMPVLCPENELPRQRKLRANPCADGIVYPCGAIPWSTGRWLVSYGVHDERCCLQSIDLAQASKVSCI